MDGLKVATVDQQETFLQNQQLVVRIKPVDTLGITGELIETYVVKVSFDRVYRNDNKDKTLFERTICDKTYYGFAPSLSDAIALVKRFVNQFEVEFERITR